MIYPVIETFCFVVVEHVSLQVCLRHQSVSGLDFIIFMKELSQQYLGVRMQGPGHEHIL